MMTTLRRLQTSALALTLLGAGVGCEREEPPGAAEPTPATSASAPTSQPGQPTLPEELAEAERAREEAAADAGVEPEPKWEGPYLAVTAIAAAVYSEPAFDKKKKIGYVRNGGRVPVKPEPVSKKRCSSGWYEIVGGGFICANQGTTDLGHPKVKFSIRPPDLEGSLPYQYARNSKNGTPLYRSVPSKEQMALYEPKPEKKKKTKGKKTDANDSEKAEKKSTPAPEEKTASKKREKKSTEISLVKIAKPESEVRATPDAGTPSTLDAGLAALTDGGAAADAGPASPWWHQEDIKERLHEVTLEQLSEGSDDVLAKRMVEGFYVAIDKPFRWNNRLWYKTTKGLVAPADAFWVTAGSNFQGTEIGPKMKLPVAWVYGWRKKAPLYEIDEKKKRAKPSGSAERFSVLQLTGRETQVAKTTYFEVDDGSWVKSVHVRRTDPGPPPEDLAPGEKWVDVNLKRQTLVAFVGTKPVYATLVSTGKQSKVKAKDHRTPVGEWRIREKHITTTMDGNGTAAGDLPYSIEDVPYVMYYDRSYALHAAFWHRNFGVRMSHGCVNLSPKDAKQLFFFTDPPVPEGWHGTWSSKDERPGSRIVVHE